MLVGQVTSIEMHRAIANADVLIHGIAGTVTELVIRQFLEVGRCVQVPFRGLCHLSSVSIILFWMTIFAIIQVAVADGTSPSEKAIGPIIAVAAAAAAMNLPTKRKRTRKPTLDEEEGSNYEKPVIVKKSKKKSNITTPEISAHEATLLEMIARLQK